MMQPQNDLSGLKRLKRELGEKEERGEETKGRKKKKRKKGKMVSLRSSLRFSCTSLGSAAERGSAETLNTSLRGDCRSKKLHCDPHRGHRGCHDHRQ